MPMHFCGAIEFQSNKLILRASSGTQNDDFFSTIQLTGILSLLWIRTEL